jgi:hypothetical protein
MSDQSSRRIVVTTKAGGLDRTVPQLRQAGMKIKSVLGTVGVVTGEIKAHQLNLLKTIPGITVEEDKPVQLPDPGSPLQ